MTNYDMTTPVILDPAVMRRGIMNLEASMREEGGDYEFPVEHVFAAKIYSRQLFMPKGSRVVGKIHRNGCLVVILAGDVTILSDTGITRVKAGGVFPSPPGAKRAVLAHEDSIFMTIHYNPDNERDLEKIEETLIAPNFESLGIAVADATETLAGGGASWPG